jgi:hypothetical protein
MRVEQGGERRFTEGKNDLLVGIVKGSAEAGWTMGHREAFGWTFTVANFVKALAGGPWAAVHDICGQGTFLCD